MCNSLMITFDSINKDGSCLCTSSLKDIINFLIEKLEPKQEKKEGIYLKRENGGDYLAEKVHIDVLNQYQDLTAVTGIYNFDDLLSIIDGMNETYIDTLLVFHVGKTWFLYNRRRNNE